METQVLSDEDVQCTTNHLTSFAVLVDHKGLIEKSQTSETGETGETGEGGETTETNVGKNFAVIIINFIYRVLVPVFQMLNYRHSQLLDTLVPVFLYFASSLQLL